MNKKLLLATLLAILSAGQMLADSLTPAQALARITGDKSDNKVASKVRRAKAANKMELTYTSSLGQSNTYYVFNNNQEGGYVILAADDYMPAVLGVVDAGQFDYNSIPENMKFYLKVLDANVYAQARRRVVAKALAGKAAIEPLLGNTTWGQGKPFNQEVPEYEYGKNGKEQAAVGCAACATAQVMRYHQYPTTGIGERTYKFIWDTKEGEDQKVATEETEFSTNFSEHTYDWANMLDNYTESSPNWNETQGKAVSTLLKDVGVALNMRYGTSASGGSGTQSHEVACGLVNYFGYDASIQYIDHKFYTNDEWDEMIYTEISSNRPVIFGGRGADGSGGHEYVGDGWDADGRCHINWGWDGSFNGYFYLTGPGLIPEGTGTGGSVAGASYGYGMDAIINIMPNNDQAATGKEADCRLASLGYTAKVSGQKLSLIGKFYNTSYHETADTLGIQIQMGEGDNMTSYNYFDNSCVISPCNSVSDIDVNITDFILSGDYKIVPIMKGPNDQYSCEIKMLSTFKAATLTVSDGENDTKVFSVTNNDAPKIEAEGEITTNKKCFRPTKKNDDGTLDAEILEIICEGGIKNCDEKGQKLDFGCEFYDLTESNDSVDVYWLSNYAATDAEELAPGASIKKISVEILPELEAGHMYEINPIFYVGVDDSLDDEAYWNQLDNIAQYVDLGDNEAPVIEIEADAVAVAKPKAIIDSTCKIVDINGRAVSAKSLDELLKGIYIVKDARGVRKIVKK